MPLFDFGKRVLASAVPVPEHEVLQDRQFAAYTNKEGGGTMNAHTGRLLQKGEHGYVVSGIKSDSKTRIDEGVTKGHTVNTLDVAIQRARVRAVTQNNPDANVGSWKTNRNGKNIVTWDASETEHNRKTALTKMADRNEDALWNNHRGEEIVNGQKKNLGRKMKRRAL